MKLKMNEENMENNISGWAVVEKTCLDHNCCFISMPEHILYISLYIMKFN